MADAGYEYGSRFPPRSFRRGATRELKVGGSNDAQIKGAGCWRAMGFMAYADTKNNGRIEDPPSGGDRVTFGQRG